MSDQQQPLKTPFRKGDRVVIMPGHVYRGLHGTVQGYAFDGEFISVRLDDGRYTCAVNASLEREVCDPPPLPVPQTIAEQLEALTPRYEEALNELGITGERAMRLAWLAGSRLIDGFDTYGCTGLFSDTAADLDRNANEELADWVNYRSRRLQLENA